MTSKEKAVQLFNKYDSTLTYLESKSKAKQCALIAVDEILNFIYTDYWQDVKTELTNL